MISPILRTFAKLMIPFLLGVSLWILMRGHNAPGGGFIGSLVYTIGYCLLVFAFGVVKTRDFLPFDPRSLIGIGLMVAITASAMSLTEAEPFFQAQWGLFDLPMLGAMLLGTPQLFDLGVYLVVSGTMMIIINAFEED